MGTQKGKPESRLSTTPAQNGKTKSNLSTTPTEKPSKVGRLGIVLNRCLDSRILQMVGTSYYKKGLTTQDEDLINELFTTYKSEILLFQLPN